jgi:gamma-glutamyl-gamma-aminobutyrate hydrolase PuuD
MRLVSAYYSGVFPFNHLNNVNEVAEAVNDPAELKQGDMLVVWGGADISPDLYNKGRSSFSHAGWHPSHRDVVEWKLMQQAKTLNIPIIGVCRGAQMLCALEGGFLYQDVDGHSGKHTVITDDGHEFTTNSIHHQMMVPQGDFRLVGWTETRSNGYWDVGNDGLDVLRPVQEKEPEFVFYPKIKGFAIQWHPEMMGETTKASTYILNFINSHA